MAKEMYPAHVGGLARVGELIGPNEWGPELLKPKNMTSFLGRETGRVVKNGIACYRSKPNSVRYLYYKNGMALSGLGLVDRGYGHAKIELVYTHPGHRRMGYAAKLLQAARKKFKSVVHSHELSRDGLAWSQSVGLVPSKALSQVGSAYFVREAGVRLLPFIGAVNPQASAQELEDLYQDDPLAAMRNPNASRGQLGRWLQAVWDDYAEPHGDVEALAHYLSAIEENPAFLLVRLETPNGPRDSLLTSYFSIKTAVLQGHIQETLAQASPSIFRPALRLAMDQMTPLLSLAMERYCPGLLLWKSELIYQWLSGNQDALEQILTDLRDGVTVWPPMLCSRLTYALKAAMDAIRLVEEKHSDQSRESRRYMLANVVWYGGQASGAVSCGEDSTAWPFQQALAQYLQQYIDLLWPKKSSVQGASRKRVITLGRATHPRPPIVNYTIKNVEDENRKHKTFELHPRAVRESLQKGDFAKIVFEGTLSNGKRWGERMWIEVKSQKGGRYHGTLSGYSLYNPALRNGLKISFGPEHIAQIIKGSKILPIPRATHARRHS